jgi:hypothetical protein
MVRGRQGTGRAKGNRRPGLCWALQYRNPEFDPPRAKKIDMGGGRCVLHCRQPCAPEGVDDLRNQKEFKPEDVDDLRVQKKFKPEDADDLRLQKKFKPEDVDDLRLQKKFKPEGADTCRGSTCGPGDSPDGRFGSDACRAPLRQARSLHRGSSRRHCAAPVSRGRGRPDP